MPQRRENKTQNKNIKIYSAMQTIFRHVLNAISSQQVSDHNLNTKQNHGTNFSSDKDSR